MGKQIVLLVEDHIEMAKIYARILELEGYQVFHAPNGIKGLELAGLIKPNIVLCDVNMPDMDGYHFFKLFKESSFSANIPFLFLTANTSHADVRYGMNLGADDYLCKPIKRKELLEAIHARLHKKNALEQELETLAAKYADEIAQKNNYLDEIGWNVSHMLRAPIANMMAIVNLMDVESMNAKNSQLLGLLRPLPYKLDAAIRENVLRINSITTKKRDT